jgi:DNA-3-methyladenine glycosylase II
LGEKGYYFGFLMIRQLASEEDLKAATVELCRIELRFVPIFETHGFPSLRSSPRGLEGLLMIITEQFLSLKAAAAIWVRVKARLGTCLAADVLNCELSEFLALGLSRAKANAFHEIAKMEQCGEFSFTRLLDHDEINIAKMLCALPGVGPWTADIYLLSALGAADAWPKGDLALRVAVQDFLKLDQRPEISEMEGLSAAWQPWRAVAARLLWSHYRGLKGLPQA